MQSILLQNENTKKSCALCTIFFVKIHECDLGTSTVSEPLYGDVDGNGRVELADSIILNKVQTGAAFLTDEQFERADVNCDGLVDGIDISYIMQSLVGNVKLIDVAFGEVVE